MHPGSAWHCNSTATQTRFLSLSKMAAQHSPGPDNVHTQTVTHAKRICGEARQHGKAQLRGLDLRHGGAGRVVQRLYLDRQRLRSRHEPFSRVTAVPECDRVALHLIYSYNPDTDTSVKTD